MTEQEYPREGPAISEQEETEHGAIQADVYGIKRRFDPAQPEPEPKTWIETGRRVNQQLMAIARGVPTLMAAALGGATQLIRGLCAIPGALANRISGAHQLADRQEAKRQSELEAGQLPTPSAQAAMDRIECILLEQQARGNAARVIESPGGKVAILIVRPELEEQAQETALKALPAPQPDSRQDSAILAELSSLLNKSITELNLSVRARKCMNRLGINTLGELVQRTADELLASKDFGPASLRQVREKLAQFGLTLKGD